MRKRQFWIIVSDPKDYDVTQFNSRGKIDWDVGLCEQSNKLLKEMKKNDFVLFMESSDSLVSEISQYLFILKLY